MLKDREKVLKEIKGEIKARIRQLIELDRPKKEGQEKITDAMIERAREHPIVQLVEVNKSGMAHCIAHPDKHPSMDCRNNFCHCYTFCLCIRTFLET